MGTGKDDEANAPGSSRAAPPRILSSLYHGGGSSICSMILPWHDHPSILRPMGFWDWVTGKSSRSGWVSRMPEGTVVVDLRQLPADTVVAGAASTAKAELKRVGPPSQMVVWVIPAKV